TWMISKGTLLRDCARKSALVQPVARTGPAGIVRPCFYTEKYRIQKPAIGKTYSGSEAASLLPSSRRGEELLPGRRAAAHLTAAPVGAYQDARRGARRAAARAHPSRCQSDSGGGGAVRRSAGAAATLGGGEDQDPASWKG